MLPVNTLIYVANDADKLWSAPNFLLHICLSFLDILVRPTYCCHVFRYDILWAPTGKICEEVEINYLNFTIGAVF